MITYVLRCYDIYKEYLLLVVFRFYWGLIFANNRLFLLVLIVKKRLFQHFSFSEKQPAKFMEVFVSSPVTACSRRTQSSLGSQCRGAALVQSEAWDAAPTPPRESAKNQNNIMSSQGVKPMVHSRDQSMAFMLERSRRVYTRALARLQSKLATVNC